MGDPVYNGKLLAFEGDPTVENISIYIMEKMKKLTEGYVSCEVESVKVHETDTCFAEVQNVY